MARFYDLNLSVKTKTLSYAYRCNEIFAYPKKSSRPILRNVALVEIEASR